MAQLRKGAADCFHMSNLWVPLDSTADWHPRHLLSDYVVERTYIYRLFLAHVYNSKPAIPNALRVLDSISGACLIHHGPVTAHKYAAQFQVGK
jgi:hypothetical protein